jgi:hypothetical protein
VLPNFIIIGAAKSGTTSLYHYADQHPSIFMSRNKEPRFFAYEGTNPTFKGPADDLGLKLNAVTDLATYEALFADGRDALVRGEGSTVYLAHPTAPERMSHRVPDAKLVAILRNPIDRAYADYTFMKQRGHDPARTFREALDAERERANDGWSPGYLYVAKGFYFQHLTRYLNYFARDQLKVYFYEDLLDNPASLAADLFAYLNVDSSVTVDTSPRYNLSGVPRSAIGQALINKMRQAKTRKGTRGREWLLRAYTVLQNRNLTRAPHMQATDRDRLREQYESDVESLGSLIGRDLSGWLVGSRHDRA